LISEVKITGDIMFDEDSINRSLRRFARHTASVPKGFLRYQVLRLLKRGAMSGSEIMEAIEKRTGGRWKPSPGSVYPLLAWLLESGYTEEVPKEKGVYLKRYLLTEKGMKYFEEQDKLKEKIQDKIEFFTLSLINSHSQMTEIRKPVRRFVKSLFELREILEENPTQQSFKEIGQLLDNIAERTEEISRRLKENRTGE
jgi:DNA-binding PadR family transcriptional regulator